MSGSSAAPAAAATLVASVEEFAFDATSELKAAGAALSADQGGVLVPLGGTGRQRSIIGTLATELAPGNVCLFDRLGSFDVELASADFQLTEASLNALGNGANRALVGEEIIQFAKADWLSGRRWRIAALLRGRGGTEAGSRVNHRAGTSFILLDDRPVALASASLGQANTIAATGLADPAPVVAQIAMAGATLRPLRPVHPHTEIAANGALVLAWTRRARGAWEWRDLVETPLNEEAERYRVGLGDPQAPILQWEVAEPRLVLPSATRAELTASHPGQPVWVSQIGIHAPSDPLLLHIIP